MANSLNLRYFLSAEGQNRTADTRIFSPLLYRLSYLGPIKNKVCPIRSPDFCQDFFKPISPKRY